MEQIVEVLIASHCETYRRLAEERQKAAEKTPLTSTNAQEKIVESFKAAGVENFHMKAAVPGTEIPGHEVLQISP